MLGASERIDVVTSFIAQEKNEHLQRDIFNANLKHITGLMILRNVEEYGDQADYDALIQGDTNAQLLRLIGLYMSEDNPGLREEYTKSIIDQLTYLTVRYWKREVEDAVEEKISYYQNRETREDEEYDSYTTRKLYEAETHSHRHAR